MTLHPTPQTTAHESVLSSHAIGETDTPLLQETIGQHLRRTVAAHPDREALVDVPSGRRWCYRELLVDVDALAHGLMQLGITPGDRIAVWAGNLPEWTLLQYATAEIGAILVTVNPAFRTRELGYVLAQSGARMLVAASDLNGVATGPMIAAVRADCPALELVTTIGDESWRVLYDRSADDRPLRTRRAQLSPDDPINIQYTSGTTGHPKGATLSHRNILNNAYFVGLQCGYTERERVCVPVPLFHTFGMVLGNLATMAHGGCLVYPAEFFDAGATLAAVDLERCTSLLGVPAMFLAELRRPDFECFDLSSLRTGMMGGSPCPVEVMKQVINRMGIADVTIVYGMTETSPVSTQTHVDDSLRQRVTTVGRVHPHVEVKIVDPRTGATVPRGTEGELCTRGYSVMLGYWREPDKTAEAVDDARWMHTGDLATMDVDGYVNITGRLKDMVIRGGENISPREIEEFLHTHPDIEDVQVVGVPDARVGEELMAWVRLRSGAPVLSPAALRTFATGTLAAFKIPRYVAAIEEFPMTASGKVRKVALRQMAVDLLQSSRSWPPSTHVQPARMSSPSRPG